MQLADRAFLEAIPRKTTLVNVTWLDVCPRDEEGNPILQNDQGYAPDSVVRSLRLREMSGTERDDHEIAAMKKTQNGAGTPKHEVEMKFLRARLVTLCLVDDSGERMYKDGEVKKCSDLPQGILLKLFVAAQKLNGLDADAKEDAAKNSASDLEGASTSSLPENSAKPSLNS